jgi:hypothetical protein
MTAQLSNPLEQNNLVNKNKISVRRLKINEITDLLEILNFKKTYNIKTDNGYATSCVFYINDKEIIAHRTYQQQKGIVYTIGSLDFKSIELLDFLVNSLPEESKNIILNKFYDVNYFNYDINVKFNRYIYYESENTMRRIGFENLDLRNIKFKERKNRSVSFTFNLPNISLEKKITIQIYENSPTGSFYIPDGVYFDIKNIFKKIEKKESKNYPDISFYCFECDELEELKKIISFFIIETYKNSSEYLLKTTFNEKNCLIESYFKSIYIYQT